jgi:hypothetical protein
MEAPHRLPPGCGASNQFAPRDPHPNCSRADARRADAVPPQMLTPPEQGVAFGLQTRSYSTASFAARCGNGPKRCAGAVGEASAAASREARRRRLLGGEPRSSPPDRFACDNVLCRTIAIFGGRRKHRTEEATFSTCWRLNGLEVASLGDSLIAVFNRDRWSPSLGAAQTRRSQPRSSSPTRISRFVVAEQTRGARRRYDVHLEPPRRDSAAAIAAASEFAVRRDANAVLLVLAADHLVLMPMLLLKPAMMTNGPTMTRALYCRDVHVPGCARGSTTLLLSV